MSLSQYINQIRIIWNINIADVIHSQDHHEGIFELFSENVYLETFCSNFDDLCVMESTILTRKK